MMPGNRVLALCGKGGVGKTALSACLVRQLISDPARRVLAVDADPAMGLADALGIAVTTTVDDIRTRFIGEVKAGHSGTPEEVRARLDYAVFSALIERRNLAFLAVGRPETEGCYCQVNEFLKEVIASLAGHFDVVVIDGEAGIEQINRRVMERVTDLVLVSDPSARGVRVAETIGQVADSILPLHRTHLIVNRVVQAAEIDALCLPRVWSLAGWIGEDALLRNGDIQGQCLLDLPFSPALEAVAKILPRLLKKEC
jgi:CO dehydrogenase maturation factor